MMRSMLALLVVARVAGAQTSADTVRILTAAQLRATADSMPHAASRTAQLGRGAGYTYALTQRDSAGGEESHAAWTDVFVIQSGAAALLYGGTADGARESTPGEWRGGTIRGGRRRSLQPGDVVVIPAGVPHQMLLGPGERIAYLAFKIAASPAK
jgi:mannose-6-phosphate isomerase-like protein (cupin superfamily)